MQHQHLRVADLAQEVPAVQHELTALNAHGMDARRLQQLPRAVGESPKAVRAPALALQLPAKALPAVRHDILVEKVPLLRGQRALHRTFPPLHAESEAGKALSAPVFYAADLRIVKGERRKGDFAHCVIILYRLHNFFEKLL